MLIKLYVTISDVAEVAKLYNKVRIWRATSVNGTYAQITTAATRIQINPGISTYTYYDESGEATYWYKTDFWNETTDDSSELSDPVLGDDAEVLTGIMTVEELKSIFLTGVDLTDDAGNPYPDIMFEFGIRAAIAWAETVLDLDLRPTTRTERYPYDRDQWKNAWGYLQLDKYPCLDWDTTVHYVKMFWPSSDEAFEFPSDWVRLEKGAGQINLIPTSASIGGALLVGGAILPTLLNRYGMLPRTIEVKYGSGFAAGAIPYDIRYIIGLKAIRPILDVAGDLVAGAGIAGFSLSVDGLSQSVNTTSSSTNAGYGARIISAERELKQQVPLIKRFYKNVGLAMG